MSSRQRNVAIDTATTSPPKKTKVEYAVYITSVRGLEYWTPKYQRIYFGNEFCSNLIPTGEEIQQVLAFANDHDLKLSLLTCQVNNYALAKFQTLFPILRNGDEIILNDWGIFSIIKKNFKRLLSGCVLGKFLNNNINILQPSCRQFLMEQGFASTSVDRLEMENVVFRASQTSLSKEITGYRLKISLYYPYSYVTTARYCPTAYCDSKGYRDKILYCKKECQKYTFVADFLAFTNRRIILKGNTWFIEQDLPRHVEQCPNIDRIVYMPTIPI